MLNDAAARAAKPKEKSYKLTDGGGLHLLVLPSGSRSWRWRYAYGGKERQLVFGHYPEVGLKRAREMRDDARQVLRQGRDPGLETRKARHARATGHTNTFEQVAREWHALQVDTWKPVHAADVITSMERDLFPVIGAFPVVEIDEGLLLGALRPVEKRGAIETCHRLRQRAERVFRYAAGAGIPNSNPAVNVREALKPVPPKKRWPALTEVPDIRALLRDADAAKASPITKLASRFMALTAQRPGMPRHALWSEFEGIDWARPDDDAPAALWRVPAEKMKLELELREDQAFEHVVPLAPAAVEVLHAIRRLTGRGPRPFPGAYNLRKLMSENAVGYLYNREGWKGRHVPHGWRSSFSTIMNGRAERAASDDARLVIDRLIIDLMLAHQPVGMSSNEFRYNRQRYMERRRELACEWADLIMVGAVPAVDLLEGPRRRKA